jgi:hypothetical protein
MGDKCPVCKTDIPTPNMAFNAEKPLPQLFFSCGRCGDFTLDKNVLHPDILRDKILHNDPVKIAVLSHWIRTRHESTGEGRPKDDRPLTEELVNDILKNPRPSPAEQADYYVRWIGDNVKVGGQYVAVEPLAIQAIVGSATLEEFELVSTYLLRDARLINHGTQKGSEWRQVTLSFAGWEYYRKLKSGHTESRTAFMAMEYNREPLEGIVDKVFRDAVRQTGFDLFLLRDRPIAGLIDNRLRVEIQAARFLIADRNPGVYWEAGYAEGLEKPVIYTCEKKVFEDSERKPHFDTNHHQTVLWDAEEPKTAARDLKATIRATLPAEAKPTDD